MSRLTLCLTVPDASKFARALGTALKTRHATGSPPPGHVELLNLMARALGHRNLQSLQAARVVAPPVGPLADDGPTPPLQNDEAPIHALPEPPLAVEDRPAPARLSDNARKALMQFDSRGRLQNLVDLALGVDAPAVEQGPEHPHRERLHAVLGGPDRKSTRLNSSHW